MITRPNRIGRSVPSQVMNRRRSPWRFNRWQWEPLFFLIVPILFLGIAIGSILFVLLNDGVSRFLAAFILASLLVAISIRFRVRTRHERSP